MLARTKPEDYMIGRLYRVEPPEWSARVKENGTIRIIDVDEFSTSCVYEVVSGLGGWKPVGAVSTFDIGSPFSYWLVEIEELISEDELSISFNDVFGE